MQIVLRLVSSGVIAGLVALLTVDFKHKQSVATQLAGNLFYEYLEIIVFLVVFISMYFTLSWLLAKKIAPKIENSIKKYTMVDILMHIIGLTIGLGLANLSGLPFMQGGSELLNLIWAILLYVGFGYFGVYIVHIKKDEIRGWFIKKQVEPGVVPKVLDTSVIIDGRIIEICETGFLEGPLIVPVFILNELRHIADHSDAIKRTRGRYGLDVLKKLQECHSIKVEVVDMDFQSVHEVDMKLLRLAQKMQGAIITHDFNLNKVAGIHHVRVLNINTLANAVKPMVIPEERLSVLISKQGKEKGQGVAYLNDGTMIVIENGGAYVGKTKEVLVSKVLQTSAGRMIFAKVIS